MVVSERVTDCHNQGEGLFILGPSIKPTQKSSCLLITSASTHISCLLWTDSNECLKNSFKKVSNTDKICCRWKVLSLSFPGCLQVMSVSVFYVPTAVSQHSRHPPCALPLWSHLHADRVSLFRPLLRRLMDLALRWGRASASQWPCS